MEVVAGQKIDGRNDGKIERPIGRIGQRCPPYGSGAERKHRKIDLYSTINGYMNRDSDTIRNHACIRFLELQTHQVWMESEMLRLHSTALET